jgi:hypothetical protein
MLFARVRSVMFAITRGGSFGERSFPNSCQTQEERSKRCSVHVRRIALLALGAFCLVPFYSSAQSAPPIGDTFSNSAVKTQKNGSATLIAVQTTSTGYIQFNLGTVPPNATITKATLRLYVDAFVTAGRFDVYELNAPWSESTLTYNNAPALGISATGGNSSCRHILQPQSIHPRRYNFPGSVLGQRLRRQ